MQICATISVPQVADDGSVLKGKIPSKRVVVAAVCDPAGD